jgi:hypothetical protein
MMLIPHLYDALLLGDQPEGAAPPEPGQLKRESLLRQGSLKENPCHGSNHGDLRGNPAYGARSRIL